VSQTIIVVWEDNTGELRERNLNFEKPGKGAWEEEKHTFAIQAS
jgi:hypothetical protein